MTARALNEARTAIIDTIACTLAGIPEPCAQILLETPGSRRCAPACARVRHQPSHRARLDAALINGTASHALDYDDVSGRARRTPFGTRDGAHLCARRAAEGFRAGRRWRPTSSASRPRCALSRAVNFHHYDKGWHRPPRSARSARRRRPSHLLGLDVARTAKALALAASFSCGIKANFGTMTKPLRVGHVGLQRPVRGADRRARLRVERRRARAPAGAGSRSSMARGNYWPERMFGTGARLWEIGSSRERSQAVSLLRLDASSHRHDAGAGARGRRYGR